MNKRWILPGTILGGHGAVMKRIALVATVVTLLVGGAAIWLMPLRLSQATAGELPAGEIVTVGRDTILETVNATGRLEPQREVALTFELSGTVAELLVEEGQQVQAGQPLARLDTSDLELSLQKTLVELHRAEAQLNKTTAEADADDVASAQASLESARAKYEDVLAGADQDEVTVALADLRRAEIALKKTQQAYDEVSWRGDIGQLKESTDLEKASIDYESAKAKYNLAVKGADTGEIKSAAAQVTQAEAALNKLLKGARAEEIALEEIGIESARLSVRQAEQNLARVTLYAPIDGTVTEVNVEVGERASNQPAFVLADLSPLHVDVDVDEIDIGRVQVGQPASIVLDAFPGEEFAGRVTKIAVKPDQETGGVITYLVTVETVGDAPRLRAGMTANAAIETNLLEDVLVIPDRAVQVEAETGRVYVERLTADGEISRVEVALGKRGQGVIEVRAGLSEGDRLLVPGEQQATQAQQSEQGGFRPGNPPTRPQ